MPFFHFSSCAGNLVLPPFLGYNAGSAWFWVAIGFAISAVIIPIMAIYGHSRLQGSMLDFGKKVSPLFALVYSVLVYAISISLPSPRTASVAYEMAIEPYFEMSALTLSILYFVLVLIFVLNRNRILSINRKVSHAPHNHHSAPCDPVRIVRGSIGTEGFNF